MSDEELRLRRELAAVYRLVAHYRMTDLIFTHISARVPGPEHHFLINPYGMLFEEITASNLVKIDSRPAGRATARTPSTPPGSSSTAPSTPRAAGRPVRPAHPHHGRLRRRGSGSTACCRSPDLAWRATAGSRYHDYEGVALNLDEQQRLVADLGRQARR